LALAAVTPREQQISDNDIDNVSFRRHVVAFGDYYLLCGPTLLSLALDPAIVTAGTPSHATVTLSAAAPGGGSVVTLTSADTTSATVPESVTVEQGKTQASFHVLTLPGGPGGRVEIAASLMASRKTATLTVLNLGPLTLSPDKVAAGISSRGQLSLSSPAPEDTTVALSSGSTGVATVPASVVFAAGQTTADFPVQTHAAGQAEITATLGGLSRTATQGVYALTSLTLDQALVPAGAAVRGTVGLTGVVPAEGVDVSLSSTNVSTTLADTPASVLVARVPDRVRVPGGTDPSASFNAATERGGQGRVVAALGSQTKAALLSAVGITDFKLFTMVPGTGLVETYVTDDLPNSSLTGKVTLSGAAPSPALISLVADGHFVDLPTSVTVAPGSAVVTFTVRGVNPTTGTRIRAELAREGREVTLRINEPPH
jgi:hypothetical protein